MPSWSAQRATKAYLQALRMGKRKEPGEVEFLAAIAAGNNSQLMVMASAGGGSDTTLALVCASQQAGGRIICILRNLEEVAKSTNALGQHANIVEFVVGDAWKLLSNDYKTADFVLIDCKIDCERVGFPLARGRTMAVGYNAVHGGEGQQWWRSGLGAQFLPIGEGLLVGRISRDEKKKKKRWVFF